MGNLIYTFQFVTRRNYNLIKTAEDEVFVKNVFIDVLIKHNFKLLEFVGHRDTVTLSIETSDTSLSPAQISHYLRTKSSTSLRNVDTFMDVKIPSLWKRENTITTGSVYE